MVISLDGNAYILAGASSWTGVHQSVPLGSAVTGNATSTTPQLTFSSAVDEIVVGHVAAVSASAANLATSDTEVGEVWNVTTNAISVARQTGAASVTLDWSGDTAAYDWVATGVAIKPAGASTLALTGSASGSAHGTQAPGTSIGL